MDLWTGFVDVLYAILSSVSTAFGGNMGLAIAVVSFSVRMALLPWTLRFAYRSLATQAVLKKIAPQLKRIRQQYKNDPQRIWEETAKLHRQHGVKALDGSGFLRNTPDRQMLWACQTPQTFRVEVIRAAHKTAREGGWSCTDDATLVCRTGCSVKIIEGSPENFKVTTPTDLALARRMISRET